MSAQLTIIGRFVQGGLTLQPKKNDDGTPALDKTTHQPINEQFLAIAVPKNDPNFPAYWAAYNAQARASFPQLFDAAGNCTHPRFAWKMQDGDGVDKNGKSVKDKPGFAGNYIFKFNTRYQATCYMKDAHGNMQQIMEPEKLIKCGYQIAVSVGIDGNGVAAAGAGAAVPGLYASPNLVLLVRPDEEILRGPDPNAAFAGINTQMPSSVPAANGLAPPALPSVAVAALPLPAVASVALPLPGAVTVAALPLPGAALPAAGNFPLPSAAVATGPVYQMTASAQGATRDQLNKLGWTDDALLASGHMTQVG